MSSRNKVRCYDYVNHPYAKVKDALSRESNQIFQQSTKSAAARVQDVVAELRVNLAGIDLSKDVRISIKGIKEIPKKVGSPPKSNIELQWEATENPGLFPVMHGELSIYPLTATETQLDFAGEYQVPLGALGSVLDAAIGHRIAEASVLRFINDVATHLRSTLPGL
ncbi:MAG: hypothetical protein HKN76_15750 [Saprospiraceae bacterium]|nr:hypothetical protein [Saprospiraceae bacterium]